MTFDTTELRRVSLILLGDSQQTVLAAADEIDEQRMNLSIARDRLDKLEALFETLKRVRYSRQLHEALAACEGDACSDPTKSVLTTGSIPPGDPCGNSSETNTITRLPGDA